MSLRPLPSISQEALAAGQRALVRDAAWASMTGAFSGGVILVAFALSLGASPIQIGLLAAIPFIAQAGQLPATLLIERFRQRRRIGVFVITTARVLILSIALIPLLPSLEAGLLALLAVQIVIAILHAIGACAVNSWLHQLIPQGVLGNFFAQRLFWGTAFACAGTLGAAFFIEHFPLENKVQVYGLSFAIAGCAGFVSSYFLARAPEPQMPPPMDTVPMRERLRAPFRHRNFRRLLVFLGAWNFVANLTAPFLTVYLMQQLGYPLTTVTSLSVVSQLANALTLFMWGRLSDRLSNKSILAVMLPVQLLSMLALVFVSSVPHPTVQLSLLAVVHIVLGIAGGGIGLAIGNFGLKLAPQGEGTAYLASIGLVSAVAGGLAPIIAGAIAQAFQAAELSAIVRWVTATRTREVLVFQFAHWEFLFGIAALLGFYVMHALSRVEEGREVSEREVMQQIAFEAMRTVDNLSSVGGAIGSLFSFDRWWDRLLGRDDAVRAPEVSARAG